MKTLHIVQGGVDNGDKEWLMEAARNKLHAQKWVVPKTVLPEDEVVIYVQGYGFFATGIINSLPKKRKDWHNRYGAGLREIRLIEPPISIGSIKKQIPELDWANYPRSITTPTEEIAEKVKALIAVRRKTGMPDIDEKSLLEANIEELRKVALLKSQKTTTSKEKNVIYRARSLAIKLYVLKRSKGYCEGCRQFAPFKKSDFTPYLEPHHTKKLSDDGPDHPKHVIALCPNCHRRAHYAVDANSFNARLIKYLGCVEKE